MNTLAEDRAAIEAWRDSNAPTPDPDSDVCENSFDRALVHVYLRRSKEKRHSRTEAARAIGVKRQAVTDWFAERQEPTGEQVLAIQEPIGPKALL